MTCTFALLAALLLAPLAATHAADLLLPGEISAAAYPSIHAAVAANPNTMIFVQPGDHMISERIHIRGERAGLYGPGRIIQRNADQPIIEIVGAGGAEIRDVTLTRPEGRMETDKEGILAVACRDLVIENVRVIDNRTRSGAITLRECRDSRISRCLVRNYMRVTVDERIGSPEWCYAFNCTDGTAISAVYSIGTLTGPRGLHFSANLFPPGSQGVCNHEMKP